MAKIYLNENVYEATQKRLDFLFNEFEKIVVAFSGGKDSGLLLNLCFDYASNNNCTEKLAMYHLDYEAQYQSTTDYVEKTFNKFNIEKYWLCLPIKAQCSTSMYQSFWKPWEKEKQDIWVRKMPKNSYVINEENCEFDYNDWDYKIQDNFSHWIAEKNNKKTCILVGIRTQESLNRQSAITSRNKVNQYKNTNYILSKDNYSVAYPIYDWQTRDIWIANAKFKYEYNSIYDLYYQAGIKIEEMRVASPFNDCASNSLKYYKVIDPQNWGKMVSRVNGVNFTGLYGGTTAMGWKNITKPDSLTWKEYLNFLLSTLPTKTRNEYLQKFETSIKFWKEKGGVLSNKTIQEIKNNNSHIKLSIKSKNNYHTDKLPVTFKEYPDDLDVTNFREVPTYKRMCVCILKNDHTCKYMGFSQTKEYIEKRKRCIEKWEKIL